MQTVAQQVPKEAQLCRAQFRAAGGGSSCAGSGPAPLTGGLLVGGCHDLIMSDFKMNN